MNIGIQNDSDWGDVLTINPNEIILPHIILQLTFSNTTNLIGYHDQFVYHQNNILDILYSGM